MTVNVAKQVLLPTLSSHLLQELRTSGLELPPPSLLNAPETILHLGWGKFMRGYVPDFVQLANQDGRYAGRILACSASQITARKPRRARMPSIL